MNPVRNGVAVALVGGVAVASLALPAVANAHTMKTTDRAAAAAGYLARQLVGTHHDHYVDLFEGKKYADYGETADAVLAMDAGGGSQAAAARATKWLEAHTGDYIGTAPNIYPGDAAKLLLVAEAQHVNPESFGGTDLVGAIVGDEGAGTGTLAGQYQNPGDTKYGSNMISQSLAVLALANGSTFGGPDAAAVGFLQNQQCLDGGFQVSIRPSGDCSGEDVDTTAYAIQALQAADGKTGLDQAITWLRQQRNSDGGWGETPGAKSDANSTAIAVEALVATHHAATGVSWLRRHQQNCKAKVGRGAVRLAGSRYNAVDDLRATSQAGVALALESLTEVDKNGSHAGAPVLKC